MELPPFRQILGALGMLMTRDNYHSMKVDSVCSMRFPVRNRADARSRRWRPTWLAHTARRAPRYDVPCGSSRGETVAS